MVTVAVVAVDVDDMVEEVIEVSNVVLDCNGSMGSKADFAQLFHRLPR